MDVYALYALWWELGSGKEAYGHNSGAVTFTPSLRVKAIDEAFYQALTGFAQAVHLAVNRAIYQELEDCCDNNLVPHQVLREWMRHQPQAIRDAVTVDRYGYALTGRPGFFSRVGYHNIINWFNAPFWEEHADMYGGPAWAKITAANTALLDQLKHSDVKDVMSALDKLLDLHHNTGSILSKNKVGLEMSVDQKTLDIRARLRSVKDFLPYVSSDVKKLITAASNSLTEAAMKQLRA